MSVKHYRVRFADGEIASGFTKAAAARRHVKLHGRAATVETFERGHWISIVRQAARPDERAHYRCDE